MPSEDLIQQPIIDQAQKEDNQILDIIWKSTVTEGAEKLENLKKLFQICNEFQEGKWEAYADDVYVAIVEGISDGDRELQMFCVNMMQNLCMRNKKFVLENFQSLLNQLLQWCEEKSAILEHLEEVACTAIKHDIESGFNMLNERLSTEAYDASLVSILKFVSRLFNRIEKTVLLQYLDQTVPQVAALIKRDNSKLRNTAMYTLVEMFINAGDVVEEMLKKILTQQQMSVFKSNVQKRLSGKIYNPATSPFSVFKEGVKEGIVKNWLPQLQGGLKGDVAKGGGLFGGLLKAAAAKKEEEANKQETVKKDEQPESEEQKEVIEKVEIVEVIENEPNEIEIEGEEIQNEEEVENLDGNVEIKENVQVIEQVIEQVEDGEQDEVVEQVEAGEQNEVTEQVEQVEEVQQVEEVEEVVQEPENVEQTEVQVEEVEEQVEEVVEQEQEEVPENQLCQT